MLSACAVQLVHRAAGPVSATCRAESDKEIALRVGADEGSADLGKVGGTNLTSAADGGSSRRRSCFRREYSLVINIRLCRMGHRQYGSAQHDALLHNEPSCCGATISHGPFTRSHQRFQLLSGNAMSL